jgi:AcrR family transcriptional regulator
VMGVPITKARKEIGRFPGPQGALEKRVPRARKPTERVRRVALATTTDLLGEFGLDNFSMDDVVRRSGLSKSTLYRWWPSKGSLAFDAFQEKIRVLADSMEEFMPYEDQGQVRQELLTQVQGMLRLLALTDNGKTLADLIAEGRRDEHVAESFRRDFLMPRRRRSREIIQRELTRHGAPGVVDADIALDLLYGAIYFRLLVRHSPLDEEFGRKIVDFVVSGLQGSVGSGVDEQK